MKWSGKKDKVLRLKRSIYGLKQSARVWNIKATSALLKIGFKQGKADKCLFKRVEQDGSITYVLIYVDDLLVAGATDEVTKEVADQLDQEFSIKDMGAVSHYLGIQIQREDDSLFLVHQCTKISQMLEAHNLLEPKPVAKTDGDRFHVYDSK